MILPINRAYRSTCIFCGESCIYTEKQVEQIWIRDGRRKVERRFHRDCYLENARKSKAQRKEG